MTLSPGDHLTLTWLVNAHSNAAAVYAYPIEVDVFVAPETEQWHPDADGKVALLVEQDWLDDTDPSRDGYARHFVDGTIVDAADPGSHPRIDSLEVQ